MLCQGLAEERQPFELGFLGISGDFPAVVAAFNRLHGEPAWVADVLVVEDGGRFWAPLAVGVQDIETGGGLQSVEGISFRSSFENLNSTMSVSQWPENSRSLQNRRHYLNPRLPLQS
jgi:hypothetical protein